MIGKPINIELERRYNDYTEKWNTVLKRFGNLMELQYMKSWYKENEKNEGNEQSGKPSVNDNSNPLRMRMNLLIYKIQISVLIGLI